MLCIFMESTTSFCFMLKIQWESHIDTGPCSWDFILWTCHYFQTSVLYCPRDAECTSRLKKQTLYLMVIFSLCRIISSIRTVMSLPIRTPPWQGLHSAIRSYSYWAWITAPAPYPDSSSSTLQCGNLNSAWSFVSLFPDSKSPCPWHILTSSICENWGLILFTHLNHSAFIPQLCGWQGTPRSSKVAFLNMVWLA